MNKKDPDIRWKQRFSNFQAAHDQLANAIQLAGVRKLSDLEKQGLVQSFEFTHKIAWKVLKDYFDYQGTGDLITGSRDATREAFNKGLIEKGEIWLEMIKSRNRSSHTYNKNVAEEIVEKIMNDYSGCFSQFRAKLLELSEK